MKGGLDAQEVKLPRLIKSRRLMCDQVDELKTGQLWNIYTDNTLSTDKRTVSAYKKVVIKSLTNVS